jgi:hypothetical protein
MTSAPMKINRMKVPNDGSAPKLVAPPSYVSQTCPTAAPTTVAAIVRRKSIAAMDVLAVDERETVL